MSFEDNLNNPLSLCELCSKVCPKNESLLILPVELRDTLSKYMTKWEQIYIFSEYKKWYKNGQLWALSYYKEGELDGEYKEWYENEQLWAYGYYKEGKLDGKFKEWNKNVQL